MSNAQIEKFRARELEAPEMVTVAAHISDCDECRRLFQETAARNKESVPVSINLSPQSWFKDDHLEVHDLARLHQSFSPQLSQLPDAN